MDLPILWAARTDFVLTQMEDIRLHTQFYGTELRWNFNNSKDIVDLIFFNDIMEALQATFSGKREALLKKNQSWEKSTVLHTEQEFA